LCLSKSSYSVAASSFWCEHSSAFIPDKPSELKEQDLNAEHTANVRAVIRFRSRHENSKRKSDGFKLHGLHSPILDFHFFRSFSHRSISASASSFESNFLAHPQYTSLPPASVE